MLKGLAPLNAYTHFSALENAFLRKKFRDGKALRFLCGMRTLQKELKNFFGGINTIEEKLNYLYLRAGFFYDKAVAFTVDGSNGNIVAKSLLELLA